MRQREREQQLFLLLLWVWTTSLSGWVALSGWGGCCYTHTRTHTSRHQTKPHHIHTQIVWCLWVR